MAQLNTPLGTPDAEAVNDEERPEQRNDGRRQSGRKKTLRKRSQTTRKLLQAQQKIEEQQNLINRQRVQISRLKKRMDTADNSTPDTPRRKVKKLLRSLNVETHVRSN